MIHYFLMYFGSTLGIFFAILVIVIPYLFVTASVRWIWAKYDDWLYERNTKKLLDEHDENKDEEEHSPFYPAGM